MPSRARVTARTDWRAKPAPSMIFNPPNFSFFFSRAVGTPLSAEKTNIREVARITQTNSGASKNFATRGAPRKVARNSMPRMPAVMQNAVPSSARLTCFRAIRPVAGPRAPSRPISPWASSAIPSSPKSRGNNRRASTTLEPNWMTVCQRAPATCHRAPRPADRARSAVSIGGAAGSGVAGPVRPVTGDSAARFVPGSPTSEVSGVVNSVNGLHPLPVAGRPAPQIGPVQGGAGLPESPTPSVR